MPVMEHRRDQRTTALITFAERCPYPGNRDLERRRTGVLTPKMELVTLSRRGLDGHGGKSSLESCNCAVRQGNEGTAWGKKAQTGSEGGDDDGTTLMMKMILFQSSVWATAQLAANALKRAALSSGMHLEHNTL